MPRKLVPDAQVQQRYGVSAMCLWRWDRDPDLKFPRPVRIRGRKYRYEDEMDAFDEAHRQEAPTTGEAA